MNGFGTATGLIQYASVLFSSNTLLFINFIQTYYLGTERSDSLFVLQVRYKTDCKKFYGRILDNCNVVSSIEGVSGRETKEIWKRLYPDEPYSFDPNTSCWDETLEKSADAEKHTTYDLVSAIERQSPFYYQVIWELGSDRVIYIQCHNVGHRNSTSFIQF